MGDSSRHNFERPPKKRIDRADLPTTVCCRPLTTPVHDWFGDFVDPSDENLSSLSH